TAPDQASMPRPGSARCPSMSCSSWPQPGSRADSCFAGSRLPARTDMSRWGAPGARRQRAAAGGHSQERGWRSASLAAGSRTEPGCRGGGEPGADEPQQVATARSAGGDLRRCRRLPARTRMSRRGRAWRPPMSRSRWPQPGSRVEFCVTGRRLSARTDMPRRGIPAAVDEQQLATARVPVGICAICWFLIDELKKLELNLCYIYV
ncbi:hypothetical protein QO009_004192, partial [Brevibacillus aydinogluensis]|nr:hypothetical protein [Brevibacillus aydinogluensis]